MNVKTTENNKRNATYPFRSSNFSNTQTDNIMKMLFFVFLGRLFVDPCDICFEGMEDNGVDLMASNVF